MRTLIATPKSRCGATASSISVESFMWSNGPPADESWVILARMSRQRCACSRSVLMSEEACALSCALSCSVRSSSRQRQFGGRDCVPHQECFLVHLEMKMAGHADFEHGGEQDAQQRDRWQHQ